jgi:hypothetical protein
MSRRKPSPGAERRALARRRRGGALLPAREIREAAAAQPPPELAELARRFGCDPAAISRIVRGVVQPDAGGPLRTERPRGDTTLARTVKLSPAQAAAIDAARGATPFGAYVRRQVLTAISWVGPGTPGDSSGA